MAQENEKLTLEYVVQFEDGFKPGLRVYCHDSSKNEIHFRDTNLETGFSLSFPLGFPFNVGSGKIPIVFKNEVREDSKTLVEKIGEANWEKKTRDSCRKHRWNLVKVNSPDYFNLAVEHHIKLYLQQFDDFYKELKEVTLKFLKQHHSYFASTR